MGRSTSQVCVCVCVRVRNARHCQIDWPVRGKCEYCPGQCLCVYGLFSRHYAHNWGKECSGDPFGNVRRPSTFDAQRGLHPRHPEYEEFTYSRGRRRGTEARWRNALVCRHTRLCTLSRTRKKTQTPTLHSVVSCLTLGNRFVCLCVCLCVCVCVCVCVRERERAEKSKENSGVFSLEFAHTAHRRRRAEIIFWLIVFCSPRGGTSHHPLTQTSPSVLIIFIIFIHTTTHTCLITPAHAGRDGNPKVTHTHRHQSQGHLEQLEHV